MSLSAWLVFTQYLEVSISRQPATYTTIWLLRFHQESNLLSTIRLTIQFFRRGLASKTAMAVIILSLSFILAFPTIAGSMTGYAAYGELYLTSSNDTMLSISNIYPVAYVINDGGRLNGYDDNYAIPWKGGKTQR